jgi:uncharacterized protein (DUF58 family)
MLRNIWRYMLFLAVVGVLSILYNEYYMTILFFTLAAIPFILFAQLQYIYGKVSVNMALLVRIVKKGEVIPISVQVENTTIFPITSLKLYLTYKNTYSGKRYKKTYLLSVDANTKTTIVCDLLSEYAGNLEIRLDGIRIYDYLRLFSRKLNKKAEIKVAVLPDYEELPMRLCCNHYSSIESDVYSSVKGGDDPSEVFAIREYRAGDRQQRIHWKLSQKYNQLMIKEFSDPVNCSILLFIDLSLPREKSPIIFMDAMLECALSLSFSLLRNGQLHYLAWYDAANASCTRIRIGEDKDFFEAVDRLLQTKPYEPENDALLNYLAEYPKEQYTDVILITGEQAEYRQEALTLCRALSRQIICIGDMDDREEAENLSDEIMKHFGQVEVTLNFVDIGNVRRDLEQLRPD